MQYKLLIKRSSNKESEKGAKKEMQKTIMHQSLKDN